MLIMIAVSLILVGTTSFLSMLGYTSYIRNAIGTAVTPIQNGANHVFDSVGTFFSRHSDYDEIKKENEKLRQQLKDSEEKVYRAELAVDENEKLKEYLGIKDEHTDFVFADANITGHSDGNQYTVYTLDRGSVHGIEKGMPVITPDGVIGCISEVGITWSKVIPIFENGKSVGAFLERSGNSGIIEGTFSLRNERNCLLTYLPQAPDIRPGDRVLTNGEGSTYPKGLFIGTVKELVSDEYGRQTNAVITPAVDFSNLSHVMIITDYETVYE